jgi:rSAM/selenodomain-associated transferase 1
MSGIALLVIAKEPTAGRVKTRLCPPCTPDQAASLAAAALLDTLKVVSRTPAARRVLVFDGDPGRWRPRGFELIAQRGGGLGERLAAAFEDVGGPALLVGMDTPQLSTALLLDGLAALTRPDVDAVLGPALDGGYWSIGLKGTEPYGVFKGVPMSEPSTCVAQRERLASLGLKVYEQRPLRDIDTFDDAVAVAAEAPATRFAASVANVNLPSPIAA